jgi:chorismate mutase / prephenate dehydratase
MSSTDPDRPPPADQAAAAEAQPVLSLADLRGELDRLDDSLHDLLMQRAKVVTQVATLGAQGKKIPFRPGREAEIIRRLLARHNGPLPRRVLPRLWRELFAATTAMQGNFAITVCETDPPGGFATLAREHFGVNTPLRVHRSPAQAIAEVSSGAATAAVLPLPAEEEPARAAWWTALLHRDEPRIHVVARLPFWAPRAEGASQARAMVVAAAAPDASSHDRSLLGFELPPEMSRARLAGALTTAGLAPASIILRRDPAGQTAHGLIDVDGYVTDDDPRLASLGEAVRRPVVLGAYAVPVEGEV